MTDFLIAGGGVMGFLLARELAQAGAEVTVIDRGEFFSEASWAGGGIISPLYPWRYSAAVSALANQAKDLYRQLAAELADATGIDPELRQTGLLMLAPGDEQEALTWAAHYGRPMERVDSSHIYSHEPFLAAGFERGLWMDDVSNIRNPRLGEALQAFLESNPRVKLRNHTELRHIAIGNAAVLGFDCIACGEPERICADNYVITTGAWSGELMRSVGIPLPVHPVKGQMLLYKPPKPLVSRIVLRDGRYLIPRVDGHILAGSTMEHTGFEKETTPQARKSLQESAALIVPALADLNPVRHWAGLRPSAPDGIPFIGRAPELRNLYVNAGHFRNGLVLAPASSRLLADILLGRNPSVDPRPYQPGGRGSAFIRDPVS
jgi:glycine oxidase